MIENIDIFFRKTVVFIILHMSNFIDFNAAKKTS